MNKTQKKVCASCVKFSLNKSIKSNKKNKPKWLNKIDYVEKFINNYNNFNINYPKNYNNSLLLDLGKKNSNKKILYWAAKPNDNNSILIKDAKKAYGDFSNSGVALINDKGLAKLRFITPQNYKTINKNEKNDKTFFKHIHYVISNSDNTLWNNQIYTRIITNNLKYNDFIKKLNSKKYIVLNVLPCEMYAKDHIKDTYNLVYNKISNMSIKELHVWFKSLIDLHYPKINTLLKKQYLELYEIPIICYCAHNKCDASKIASKNLMKKGFVNVNIYEDGMKGYKEHK